MGFDRPDKPFRIVVSDTQAYRQFGNAVVVPVVEFIAEAMKPYLMQAISNVRKEGAFFDRDTHQENARAVNG